MPPDTKLYQWFRKQTPERRKTFIDEMVFYTGSHRRTIYRYLAGGAGPLTQFVLSDLTKIPVTELYKTPTDGSNTGN